MTCELAPVAVGLQLGRRVDIAVVVGRVLEQLPVLVAVAARDLDEAGRLEHEVALLALGPEAVRRPARHDDVVALPVREVAEDRLEGASALVDEDHLVALAVAVEVVHLLARPAERDLDVVVPHQQLAPVTASPCGVDAERAEVPVLRALPGTHSSRSIGSKPRDLLDAAGRVRW